MAAPTTAERVAACKQHLLASVKWKNPYVGLLEMRRHYSNYFKGFYNFKEMRMKLVTSEELEEILEILDSIEERIFEMEAV